MFLRAQLSSQLASLSDFLITIVLAKVFSLYYVYATFMGSVCGGIINCIINYRWTFKSFGVKKKYVALKYLMVWCGSILLNTAGTYSLTELLTLLLKKSPGITEVFGHMFDDVFIVSKLIVSLVVGLVWNYNMQRVFVYREQNFRKYFNKKNHTDIL